jgi:hypothetical protein
MVSKKCVHVLKKYSQVQKFHGTKMSMFYKNIKMNYLNSKTYNEILEIKIKLKAEPCSKKLEN